MNSDNFDQNEFQEFLNQNSAPPIEKSIPDRIRKDLVSSRIKLSIIYVIGSVVGYIISLLLCAQCAVGLTAFSWKISSFIHKMPDPLCPILCGAIFGIAPAIVSLIYLSRFQHRFLIFKMRWLPAIVPIVSACSLLIIGDGHNWQWRIVWLVSAILAPYLIEIVSGLYLRQGKWRSSN